MSPSKQLAQRVIRELESKEKPTLTHDSSTNKSHLSIPKIQKDKLKEAL
jgi:hypothetical protein